MRSFTSSSDARLPGGPWGRTWLLAAAAAALVLSVYEASLRGGGFVPELSDNAQLWGWVRSQVRPKERDQVVLLGASRMQLDVDPDVWAESFNGRKPLMLAVPGSLFPPTLDNLSRDESFRGVAVCDLNDGILSEQTHLTFKELQRDYVLAYQSRTAVAALDQQLSMLVQEHCTFRLTELSPRPLLLQFARGTVPQPNRRASMGADRACRYDFQNQEVKLQPAPFEPRLRVDVEQMERNMDCLEEMTERIQNRGGEVVFVRMPSSGNARKTESAEFPRAKEWDVLAAKTKAITIHFEDYSELSRFSCPDESHLDYRDAALFTRVLAAIVKAELRKRGRD